MNHTEQAASCFTRPAGGGFADSCTVCMSLTCDLRSALQVQYGFGAAALIGAFAVQYPAPAGPQPGVRPAYHQPPQHYPRPGPAPYAAAAGPMRHLACNVI